MPFFDGKCTEFIEGYRYVPEGERWLERIGENACAYRAKLCEEMLTQFGGKTYTPPIKDPIQATFRPDPSVKQIQYVMWDNGYWPIDKINGYKSAEFFRKLREFTTDMESC